MMVLPSLIFIHGAWHDAKCFNKVIAILEKKGYKCIAPQLAVAPAEDDPSPPPESNDGDIQAVQDLVINELSAGKDVVLLSHSFGGVIACSAIRGLVPSKQPGRVIGIVQISSFLVPENKSLVTLEELLPPRPPGKHWATADESFKWSVLTDETPEAKAARFYHDVAPEEAAEQVHSLRKQALSSFIDEKSTYAGWMDVPVWYLVATEDRALAPDRQRAMIELARKAGADVTMREIATSHSPFLSRPTETVEFIVDAVNAFKSQKKA